MRDEIILRAGDLELGVSPAGGGAISRFDWHRGLEVLNLMRPADGNALAQALAGNPRDMACYPLVPFSGRVDHARFTFQGRQIRLEPNFPPEPHAIHGDGWSAPWRVVDTARDRLELLFRPGAPDHPLRYEARQHFRLTGNALHIEISVRNTGEGAMPAGLGLHPFFVKTPTARLTTPVTRVWLADALNMPDALVDVPEPWDFSGGRIMSHLAVDNSFIRWPGRARIHWPEWRAALDMEADSVFQTLVVFCPDGGDIFCVEPVSNVVDGFNLLARGEPDTGVVVLAPGEILRGTVRFRPESL